MSEMEYDEMLKRAFEKVKREDTGDRFKVPEPDIVVSGRMTVVRNFGEIAGTLRRDMKHIAKFIFRELAIPGNVEENRLVLQRDFSKASIENAISMYCKEFVYCRECGKADTKLEKKNNIMFIKCEACGAERSAKKI